MSPNTTRANEDPMSNDDDDSFIRDEDLDPMIRDDYDPIYCVSNGLPFWYTRPVLLNRIPPLLASDELLGSAPPPKSFVDLFDEADKAWERTIVTDTQFCNVAPTQMHRFLGPRHESWEEIPQSHSMSIRPEGAIVHRYREEHFCTPTRNHLKNVAAHTSQHRKARGHLHIDGDTAMLRSSLHHCEFKASTKQIQRSRERQPSKSLPREPQVEARRTLEHIIAGMSDSDSRIPAILPDSDHNPNNPYIFPCLQSYSVHPSPYLYWCREINGGYSRRTLDEIEHQLQPGYWAVSTNKRPYFTRTVTEVEERPGESYKSLERLRTYVYRRY